MKYQMELTLILISYDTTQYHLQIGWSRYVMDPEVQNLCYFLVHF